MLLLRSYQTKPDRVGHSKPDLTPFLGLASDLLLLFHGHWLQGKYTVMREFLHYSLLLAADLSCANRIRAGLERVSGSASSVGPPRSAGWSGVVLGMEHWKSYQAGVVDLQTVVSLYQRLAESAEGASEPPRRSLVIRVSRLAMDSGCYSRRRNMAASRHSSPPQKWRWTGAPIPDNLAPARFSSLASELVRLSHPPRRHTTRFIPSTSGATSAQAAPSARTPCGPISLLDLGRVDRGWRTLRPPPLRQLRSMLLMLS